MPDEELLVRAARGDRQAFATLYDHLAGLVYSNVRRVLEDPVASAEVTEAVFVEVWQQAVRFDPAEMLVDTWVLVLAHRRAVERLRAEGVRGVLSEGPAPSTPGRDPAMQRAFLDLTGPQREAVELAYVEGYTYRDVATGVGASAEEVLIRIREGLVRLGDTVSGSRTSRGQR